MRVLVLYEDRVVDNNYSKAFNFLNNVPKEEIHFEAIVKEYAASVPPAENLDIIETGEMKKSTHLRAAYKIARKKCKNEDIDIYHRYHLSYFSWDPVVVFGLTHGVPTIVGPVHPAHLVTEAGVRRAISRVFGIESPTVARFIHNNKHAVNAIRERLTKATIGRTDVLLAVSGETKERYDELLGRDKAQVMPHGVNLDRFEFNTDRPSKDVLGVGKLRERKGFRYLIEAIPAIRSEHPTAEFHLLGDGPQQEELAELASDLGVENAVHFHGWVDHAVVAEWFTSARVFVHPTLSESFAHVRLEAMASGCPMVVTDVCGTDEMIRDGTDGYIVSTKSPEELAQATNELISNDELSQNFAINARERVEEEFAWDVRAERYRELYRGLISG